MLRQTFHSSKSLLNVGRCLAPALATQLRWLAQVAPAASHNGTDPMQLAASVQGLRLSVEQAHRVERACSILHHELRLPRDEMLRLLPSVLRAPHFVQNRLRMLRSLGLANPEVARLVQAAPDLLALPPVVSQPVLAERMQLLGLPVDALHAFVVQCPSVVPLLLKTRLAPGDIQELRARVSQLGQADMF